MKLPTPKELVNIISSLTSLSPIDKKLLALKIIHIPTNKIPQFYQALLKLHAAEEEFVSTVNKIDLKYEIKFQEAFEQDLKIEHSIES